MACCLRSNKSFRLAILQSLHSNSWLRQMVDVAAIASAINKGKVKSIFPVDFDREKSSTEGRDKFTADEFCAIDGVWYHRQAHTVGTTMAKVGNKDNKVEFKKLLQTGFNFFLNDELQAHPTTNSKRVIIFHVGDIFDQRRKNILVEINGKNSKIVTPKDYDHAKEWNLDDERHSHLEMARRFPHFVRYRLFVGERSIMMAVINGQGIFEKTITLHQFLKTPHEYDVREESPGIIHTGCKEQVN